MTGFVERYGPWAVVAGASEVEWASEGGGTVLGTTRAAAPPTALSPTPVDAAPAVALTGTGTGTGAGGGGVAP